MVKVRRFAGLAVAMLALTVGAVLAQAQPRPMTLIDVLNVPRLSDPQLSPDGRQVLYVLAEANWEANKRINQIWRVDADGTDSRQMTNSERGERSPRWSPDGRTIAFLSTRGEPEERAPALLASYAEPTVSQIYLLPNRGGEARQLTHHPTGVSSIAWAPAGSAIYFLASDAPTAEDKARRQARDDVYAFEERYEQRHLWKVSVGDGDEQRITNGDYTISSYTLSRDGRRIAFHKAPNPVLEYADATEVWVMDASGAGAVRLTDNDVPERGAALSPDGSQVLFLARTNQRFEKYYNGNMFLVPAVGGEARLVAAGLPYAVDRAIWSKDGNSIFFLTNLGVHSELFQLDLATETVRQLTEGRHAIGGWSLAPGADHFAMTIRQPTNPGDIWVMPANGGTAPTRVSHVFDYLARDFTLARQEKTAWKGAHGVTVEGLIYYPLDYTEGRRYPLVVQTHGGPQSSDKFGFAAQELTAKGYLVLKPNYRGSTGYGDAFLRDMVGGYFKNAHLDVMAGVDHLIEMGVADGDKLVKKGWSGGGHMTNKIITHTTRFKAAASGAGGANWISMYAQSDTRSQRTPWFGGTPWQVDAPIDVYWEHSPLKYVANVTTPTIFLVGEVDRRVPPPQSIEMYRALKSNGVPTHLYIAPREPHGWRELRHQLFRFNVELDWFETHATHRPYVWERAPGDPAPDERRTSGQ